MEEKKPRWWIKLVHDCKEIITKEQLDIIRRKHELGMRILGEPHYQKLQSKGNEKFDPGQQDIREFMTKLSNEVGISVSNIYYCIAFAKKFPDITTFIMHNKAQPDGKPISWFYITQNLLYEPRPAPAITRIYR